MRAARLLAIAAAAAIVVPTAGAGPGLFVGFTDDAPKNLGAAAYDPGRQLGAKAFRITVGWNLGQTQLGANDVTLLDRAVNSAAGMRIVLAVYGTSAAQTPLTDTVRNDYCTYVRNIVGRYGAIHDVVIWNEPNKSLFWQPQFNADGSSAAPAAYEALLARCWDVLHASRRGMNVIAPVLSPRGNDDPNGTSNVSHSPGAFIRKLGDAYRASGRAQPLFDTVGHHAYGETSSERPWKQHIGSKTIAEGDWNKLMYNLWLAFNGTAQPLPGQCGRYGCVSIWYMESGFQTKLDAAKASLYTGTETEPAPVADDAGGEPAVPPPSADSPAPDQATQIADATRLAYCQPNVGAYFNFLLFDEASLAGWQSGAFWVDRTPKDSYPAFSRAIGDVNAGTVDCSSLKGGPPSPDFMPPSVPAGLTAQAQGAATVVLSWAASSDDSGVTSYRVYRNTAQIATTTTPGYTDTGRLDSTTYAYTVRALDAAGNLSDAAPTVSVTTPPPPYGGLVLSHGPSGYWRLGERAGGTAVDASGKGNNGTYVNGVLLGLAGPLAGDPDRAAGFDGVNDYVNVPSAPTLAITGDLTIEAWVKPTDYNGYHGIVGKTAANLPAPYDFYLADGSGVPRFYRGSTGSYGAVSAAGAPPPGQWSHVAVVMQGTTVTHYLNGAPNGSGTIVAATADAGSPLRIGNRDDLFVPFKGGLDEVAVYDHALSAAEIKGDYDAGRTG